MIPFYSGNFTHPGQSGICREMQQNGSPEPIFNFDDERTWFSVMLPIHPDFNGIEKEDDRELSRATVGGPIGGPILTKKQWEVYNLISTNPFTSRVELSEILKINISATRKHIDALRKKGIIERQGGNRGKWLILTDRFEVE